MFALGVNPLYKLGKTDLQGLNKGANMATIMLKKTHNGARQKQRHNRLGRETTGYGIGFPFDGERKQRRDGGRGGTPGRKC